MNVFHNIIGGIDMDKEKEKETVENEIKGFPIKMQVMAKDDIVNKTYITTELIPVFDAEDGTYYKSVSYKILLPDGYIYGKTRDLDEFSEMLDAAFEQKTFTITYLEKSRIIVNIGVKRK